MEWQEAMRSIAGMKPQFMIPLTARAAFFATASRRSISATLCAVLVLFVFVPNLSRASDDAAATHWVGTWATSMQLADPSQGPPTSSFDGVTVRQMVRVSLGGKMIRLRLSNEYGQEPLVIAAAYLAQAGKDGAIIPGSSRQLLFHGRAGVTIPAGAPMASDALAFDADGLSEIMITLSVASAPKALTGHPASRTTSYFEAGADPRATVFENMKRKDHWFFISSLEVVATEAGAAAIVVLGDSITDGRGSTTNGNDRWPDLLARRLQANAGTSSLAVLNHGIGGNRLLRNGAGPNALSRFDRDVLSQTGVRWLVVLEGVNDLGTRVDAQKSGATYALAQDIIDAYEQIIERAHAKGIKVYGGTILPYKDAIYYSVDGDADRQKVNDWIRTSGRFDAVIDFDAVIRDPANPLYMQPEYDCGDRLHPNARGYKAMADAVDLGLFEKDKK